MDSDYPRYRMNQDVKIILVRHSVDLTKLNYSCSGSTVHLYGELKKDPPGEFSTADTENLLHEVSKLRNVKYVQCDIQDWLINSEYGSWQITRKKKAGRTPPREDTIYVIEDPLRSSKRSG
jgi:hypothetical protein